MRHGASSRSADQFLTRSRIVTRQLARRHGLPSASRPVTTMASSPRNPGSSAGSNVTVISAERPGSTRREPGETRRQGQLVSNRSTIKGEDRRLSTVALARAVSPGASAPKQRGANSRSETDPRMLVDVKGGGKRRGGACREPGRQDDQGKEVPPSRWLDRMVRVRHRQHPPRAGSPRLRNPHRPMIRRRSAPSRGRAGEFAILNQKLRVPGRSGERRRMTNRVGWHAIRPDSLASPAC